ncbi:MAG: subclass B3 metallo-beta-lactamase [Acidobacteria bacterium]|nr:subclass B3 metallo-beta-lactamase [Acidobacteriota bacterium]
MARLSKVVAAVLLSTSVVFASSNPDWTAPLEPFHIAGNLYYVGSRDLAAYLIVTPRGNILINANLESSPPLIRQSVEKLGFKWSDTAILLSSQAHFDHVGGAAEVQRETHAKYMVMDSDVKVVESGGAASFDLPDMHFPKAHVDRVLHDGDAIRLGGSEIIAHKTAGHTEGCTSFTFRVKEDGRPFDVVIVGGWSSNPGVRYVAADGKLPSYPSIEQDFRHTFKTLAHLHVDIFLGAHGVYFGLLPKLEHGARTNPSLWIDPTGFHKALAAKQGLFEHEVDKEKRTSDSKLEVQEGRVLVHQNQGGEENQ